MASIQNGKFPDVNPSSSQRVLAIDAKKSKAGKVQANVGAMTRGLSGVAYSADRIKDIIKDFATSAEVTGFKGVAQAAAVSSKFALDLLVQGSLTTSPPIPSPYFPPLLYCTEFSSAFGRNSQTSSIVAFSFRDIGNLFVEDNSQPRAIPVQQVPDADEDNVQDMGRSSGFIKLSGRVFGQAGLARFEMLRNLCKYKGKEGLVFIDKNIGKFRVYPANIPGYTSSAEFFNQYVFQITFIIVGDTNKRNLAHGAISAAIRYGLAASNAKEQGEAFIYDQLDSFKQVMDTYTAIQQQEELKKILEQVTDDANDAKVDDVLGILENGVTGVPIIGESDPEYPEFTTVTIAEPTDFKNIVPSQVMVENGYVDGIQTEYFLPPREPGDQFDVYYAQIYMQLTEDEIPPDDVGETFADRGQRIQGVEWKPQSISSDYTVVDLILRPGYPGYWTKIIFSSPPAKWGIVKVDYILAPNNEIQFYSGDQVLYGENLLYVDRLVSALKDGQRITNLVPYPISGSSLGVIESSGITELYIPELIDDPLYADDNVFITKREGPVNDGVMVMVDAGEYDVVQSTLWPGGKPGKWGKIIFSDPLDIGDFVSVDALFNGEVFFFAHAHPDYTISDTSSVVIFKWLSPPRLKVIGHIVTSLVLSPDFPTSPGNGLYHNNFLTDGITAVYWVNHGIDTNENIKVEISNGTRIFQTVLESEYVIEPMVSRPSYTGNWAKITFNSIPPEGRVVTVDCRLGQSTTSYLGRFMNAEFDDTHVIVDLLWQEPVDDPYASSTYKKIYPIPEGYVTGYGGFVPVSEITEFWVPLIVLDELHPLIVKVNRNVVEDYVITTEERTIGTLIETWTKITFDPVLPINKGDLITVDFTAQEEVEIFDLYYLESIESTLFIDECKPMKNKLNARSYFTTYVIDTTKPIEVTIDGVIIPSSQYIALSSVNRVHENKDGAIISQLTGLIRFDTSPTDTVDINVRYNRLETPAEVELLLSIYLTSDLPIFQEIKDEYAKKGLTPDIVTVTDINNSDFDIIKRVYVYPNPEGDEEKAKGREYVTYALNEFSAEFVYTKHDGIGEDYKTTVYVYSFEGSDFDAGLYDNVDNFNQQNTPFSLDILVPDEGLDDWMGRYNALVSAYADATTIQEREMASVLLGKLVDNVDLSDSTLITDEDITNAKLWLQVYDSYIESQDFVESKKMLDERTKLLELGVDGNPKEQDGTNNLTIPNEVPIPVDLPPITGWTVKELPAVMRYTVDYVNIDLYNFYDVNIVNLKTTYRMATSVGVSAAILKNDNSMFFYDSSKNYRIRIIAGTTTEEYQFSTAQELVDAINNGQIVDNVEGPTDISASELITDPEVVELQGNQEPKLFNKTNFGVEVVDFDKKTYEVFLLAVYGDTDAIGRAKLKPYDKYIKFQEIIGQGEASLTLEEGLQFYEFSKIVRIA